MDNDFVDMCELDNNFIIRNIYDDNDDYYDNEQQPADTTETCSSCYYSNGKYCYLCHKDIRSSPICWSYKDSITMRASSVFQDDNDDFDEY